jgi:hypothetical protein
VPRFHTPPKPVVPQGLPTIPANVGNQLRKATVLPSHVRPSPGCDSGSADGIRQGVLIPSAAGMAAVGHSCAHRQSDGDVRFSGFPCSFESQSDGL